MLPRFPAAYRTELEAGDKGRRPAAGKGVVANCLWDIKKLGCSTLFVAPDRSATGRPLMGRNFDFPTFGVLQKYSLVIVCRPDGKHAFASVGFPGLVGVAFRHERRRPEHRHARCRLRPADGSRRSTCPARR